MTHSSMEAIFSATKLAEEVWLHTGAGYNHVRLVLTTQRG